PVEDDVDLTHFRLSDLDHQKSLAVGRDVELGRYRERCFKQQLRRSSDKVGAIARAVINRPSLLLADEPTGNVDGTTAGRLMYLFEELNKMGTTVVIATHNDSLTRDMVHPILHLAEGSLSVVPARKGAA
ncbi:MAG: hypothetical protein V3R75_00360, partial [Alphaproteobacteria bacterium]